MADGFFDFLSGLIPESVKSGFAEFNKVDQNLTKDLGSYVDYSVQPFRDDWGNIQEGKAPRNLMKDLPGLMMMSGSGMLPRGLGPGMAKIPGYVTGQKTFDPQKGWEFVKEAEFPSVDPLKSLLQGNVLGSDFSDMLMKLLQMGRTQTKGLPF